VALSTTRAKGVAFAREIHAGSWKGGLVRALSINNNPPPAWLRFSVHRECSSCPILIMLPIPAGVPSLARSRAGSGLAARRQRLHRDHALRSDEIRGGQGHRLSPGGSAAAHFVTSPALYGFIPQTYCGDRVRRLAPGCDRAMATRSTSASSASARSLTLRFYCARASSVV